MAIRYYPSSKIKTNQKALLGEFALNGNPYSGSYYSTYDGRYFSGRNPIEGSNEELTLIDSYPAQSLVSDSNLPKVVAERAKSSANIKNNLANYPSSYFPIATDSDYSRGYLIRYFLKNVNQSGYVMEISDFDYYAIRNGTANYDVSFMQTIEILWKITGPLRNKRISQYDTRAGIIDTNKRLVENANKTFVGIKEFIGEDYSKFAKPTE